MQLPRRERLENHTIQPWKLTTLAGVRTGTRRRLGTKFLVAGAMPVRGGGGLGGRAAPIRSFTSALSWTLALTG
jgi:hypothetical protein